MYGSEDEDEFSSMSMGSDDLEAFGMPCGDGGCSYDEHDEYDSVRETYKEPYEMSSDELSVEDGEDCVDDFGIELDEDEPMSYEDFQAAAQRNDDDDDDSMGESETIFRLLWEEQERDGEQDYAWYQRGNDYGEEFSPDESSYYPPGSGGNGYGVHENEEFSSDDSSSYEERRLYGRGLNTLSYFDRTAFGLDNLCNCEFCKRTEVEDDLSSVKNNSSKFTELHLCHSYTQHFTDEGWRTLGRYIGNNNQLLCIEFSGVTLTNKITSLLSMEMQRNRSVTVINFGDTSLDVEGIQGLAPVLRASTLECLSFDRNRMIKDEGLQEIGLALASSPVRFMSLSSCDIERVTINDEQFPTHLEELALYNNKINSDGCLALARLLQKKDSMLQKLYLGSNCIDDEGAAILATSLRANTSLSFLDLADNEITESGYGSFFSLVCNISNISKTLASNHTLEEIKFGESAYVEFEDEDGDESGIVCYFDACKWSPPAKLMKDALGVNSRSSSPEEAGRKKVIIFQLFLTQREEYYRLQGVKNNGSLFSDIDCPLHLLPEILALIGENHGIDYMFAALSASVSTLTSLSMSKD